MIYRTLPFVLLLTLVAAGPVRAQEAETDTPPAPCSSEEARQFDFWIGEWDLTWAENGTGTNVITSELDGCVIQENFSGNMPNGVFKGLSVSTYNVQRGIWQQTWVDNQGGYLDFEGGWQDNGTMVLSREAERQGKPVMSRMVFKNITEDSLDWDWENSTDGGETWNLLWAIRYERRKP